jgi:hypothetical protein
MTAEREMGPGERSLRATSTAYRTAAGLPARESDEPITSKEGTSELTEVRGPEGGYGGEGDSAFTGAMSTDEQRHLERREKAVAEAEDGELTGGETATEVARVTGEDTPDVKPAGDTVEADSKPAARKTAAKKTAAKGK